jgi:hypothetical protein
VISPLIFNWEKLTFELSLLQPGHRFLYSIALLICPKHLMQHKNWQSRQPENSAFKELSLFLISFLLLKHIWHLIISCILSCLIFNLLLIGLVYLVFTEVYFRLLLAFLIYLRTDSSLSSLGDSSLSLDDHC